MDATPTNPSAKGKSPSRTPRNRTVSAEAPPPRHSVHTPLDRSTSRDLANSVRRGMSASVDHGAANNNAPTPHAKAAKKALYERRRTVFTPGKNHRRSLVEQRETPMDVLRNLGKVLAPGTKPITSSSSSRSTPAPRPGRSSGDASMWENDDDSDNELDPPTLSLPIDQDEDLPPPRLSGYEEADYTVQSVEGPRRFDPNQAGSRLSRGSLGDDVFGVDEPTEDMARPSDFFPGLLEDLQARAENNDEYERIDDDPTRRSSLGGIDFDIQMPADQDQTTFVLSEPAIDAAQSSPIREQPFAEAAAPDAPEPRGDVSDREPIEDIADRSDEGGVPMGDDDGVNEHADNVEGAAPELSTTRGPPLPPRKKKRISRHGIEYPSLPPAFVKRVAQTALQSSGISNPRISADTLAALTQASEWFFEQLGDDLGAYANHAKRKTVEESDVVTLMRRQRQIGSTSTMFSLAQRHLPRELLQELRMSPPQPSKQRRAKRPRDDDEVEEIT